ncbi:hypothetical protein, partial [Actinoplanes sp. NBRC 103695]|uniref:hypothetical protein n=1 Tax=Actinoplanes sp. NBRC 103695 TaxID=3032202 RepID=UPI0025540A90
MYFALDPDAAIPPWVRDAPRITGGVVRVYFGPGAREALSVKEALVRSRLPGTRWIDVPHPDEVAAMTPTDAGRRADDHGLPVDLPGRTDLLEAADNSVRAINDQHEEVGAD